MVPAKNVMLFFVGVLCSLTAPLFITTGLVIWEKKWAGHAVALNIFKGLLAALLYLCLLVILYACEKDEEVSPPDPQFRGWIFPTLILCTQEHLL